MAIQAAELKQYKSEVVNNTATNGGRASANEIVSGVKGNLFPDLTDPERIAGALRYRKDFAVLENADNLSASNGHLSIDKITPGASVVTIFQTANVARDTQADILGTERKYGVGQLNVDVAASGLTLVVDCEAGAGAKLVLQASDTICIHDATHREYLTIAAGGVSWTGDRATLTLDVGPNWGYLAATPTVVAACIDRATVETTVDNWVETSAAGTYDEVTYPVEGDNIGTVEQTWTITYDGVGGFTCSGDTKGNVGSGTIGADFSPNNPDKSRSYFTFRAAGHGGSWANGDTIVFQTHMASIDCWVEQDTPAGSPQIDPDSTSLYFGVG